MKPLGGLLLLACAPMAHAWGYLGHETTAFHAQWFMTSEARSWAQGILGDTSDTYLAGVASWADAFKRTDEGRFTSAYHYINARDNPPDECGVDYDRDCGEHGCVVSAIQKYTTQLLDNSTSPDGKAQALKLLVHFMADIGQPLHNEYLGLGGNTVVVYWDGKETNLHSVWDDAIARKLLDELREGVPSRRGLRRREADFCADPASTTCGAYELAMNLFVDIKIGIWNRTAPFWVEGDDADDGIGSAMRWSRDANGLVCSTVLDSGWPDYRKGLDVVDHQELGGEYYRNVGNTVRWQLAKAGYRSANWLNMVAKRDMANRAGRGGELRR